MKRPERLLYQVNKSGYTMMMIHIAFVIAYIVIVLGKMEVNHMVSFVSLANIIIMLLAFLTAVKVKTYDQKYQYVPIFLALIQMFQFFNLPNGIEGITLIYARIASGGAILSALVSSAISFYKIRIRMKVIRDKGIHSSQLAK